MRSLLIYIGTQFNNFVMRDGGPTIEALQRYVANAITYTEGVRVTAEMTDEPQDGETRN